MECLKRAVLVILILQPSIFSEILLNKNKTRFRGGPSIFSRERGALSEKKSKILQNFSLIDQIDYLGSPKSLLRLHFSQFSAPQQSFEKTGQKAVFGPFLENFDKKFLISVWAIITSINGTVFGLFFGLFLELFCMGLFCLYFLWYFGL